jgi:predicted DNA-binding transcriptional regulator AlpA
MSLRNFYRVRGELHAVDGMPQPMRRSGRRLVWSRPAIDAWLDPRTRALAAANDAAPPAPIVSDDQWRSRLSREYGR